MYHKEWDRAVFRAGFFEEFAEDINKIKEKAAAKEKARADDEKARADKYEAILMQHGLL